MLWAVLGSAGLLPPTTATSYPMPHVVARLARAPPQMMALERRQAILAAALSLSALPSAGYAAAEVNENSNSPSLAYVGDKDFLNGSDDAMARIAAKTTAANEAAKRAQIRAPPTEAELLAKQVWAGSHAKRNSYARGRLVRYLDPFCRRNQSKISSSSRAVGHWPPRHSSTKISSASSPKSQPAGRTVATAVPR